MSALVIDQLEEAYRRDSTIWVAYVYLNSQRKDEQNVNSLLASLVKQFYSQRPIVLDSIASLRERHPRQPVILELSVALQVMIKLLTRVFIIIDVLDEYVRADTGVPDFLSIMFDFQVDNSLNVLTTPGPPPERYWLFQH